MQKTHTIQWTSDKTGVTDTSPNNFTLSRATELCAYANEHFTNAHHTVTLAREELYDTII